MHHSEDTHSSPPDCVCILISAHTHISLISLCVLVHTFISTFEPFHPQMHTVTYNDTGIPATMVFHMLWTQAYSITLHTSFFDSVLILSSWHAHWPTAKHPHGCLLTPLSHETGRKYCSATVKTLVCCQYLFSHKSKPQHHMGCCEES